jgi:hypothetical protein
VACAVTVGTQKPKKNMGDYTDPRGKSFEDEDEDDYFMANLWQSSRIWTSAIS